MPRPPTRHPRTPRHPATDSAAAVERAAAALERVAQEVAVAALDDPTVARVSAAMNAAEREASVWLTARRPAPAAKPLRAAGGKRNPTAAVNTVVRGGPLLY